MVKLNLVLTMCFYDYSDKSKMAITQAILKYYKYIQTRLHKLDVNIDYVLVGSENEQSKNLVLNSGFTENEYFEWDQTPFRDNVFKIIENKYHFAWKTATNKYPNLDVLLTNGSSDFIPFIFFENLIKFYNKDIPVVYGINSYKYNGFIILVDNDIQNTYIINNIIDKRTNQRVNVIYNTEFIGGIYAFNKPLLKRINYNLKIPNGDEYQLERFLISSGAKIKKLCNHFINFKYNKCDCTPFQTLFDCYHINKYSNSDPDILNFLKLIHNYINNTTVNQQNILLYMNLTIQKYNNEHLELWDNFVETGVLGTIYHTRKFINYHQENKFQDESILIYNDNELCCIVPCCKKNNNYFSYTGATYGGPVFLKKYYNINNLGLIIDKIFGYYSNNIEFRLANNIYFKESSFMLQYVLSQKLKLKPELSFYINCSDDFLSNIHNKRNKTNVLNIIKDDNINCVIATENNDYIEYYKILKNMLKINHNTTPTHSLEELLLVKDILKEHQALYLVKNSNNIILGGVYVIKVTKQCWYTFYISRNIEYNDSSAHIIYIMYSIAIDANKNNVQYLDYGICTENQGTLINDGLANFKEKSLGGTSNYRYLFLLK